VKRHWALVVTFWAAVAWSAVAPLNPADYWLEIATPVALFVLLAASYRRFRFSDLAYGLMLAEALVLVVGAHYTHERVPLFDRLKGAFGWQRNDYDRMAHFCVGLFLVIPVREVLRRLSPLRAGWLLAMSGIAILAFAALYEITEWWIAVLASPGAAEAYLGSQGDPWDTQKDMLLDGLGALCGLALLVPLHDRFLDGS